MNNVRENHVQLTIIENLNALKELFTEIRPKCDSLTENSIKNFESYIATLGATDKELLNTLLSMSLKENQDLMDNVSKISEDILQFLSKDIYAKPSL